MFGGQGNVVSHTNSPATIMACFFISNQFCGLLNPEQVIRIYHNYGPARGVSCYTSALNVDGTWRAYHRKTGFSENHITSTVSGEWRSVLNAQQQEQLMALSKDWLLKYGFIL